jgi:hypothetical protein
MEQPTGGADEWFFSDVLLVAGLLSDKHAAPRPNTVCVAFRYRPQAVQAAAACLSVQ